MPGGGNVVRELRKGVKDGRLDVQDLYRCAGNVLTGVLNSRIYQAFRKMRK